MLILVNWAYKKLGDREKAEDLAQEVFLQIFTALRKSPAPIADIERFVWKIAHYTWCNYLRSSQRQKMCISMENLQLEQDGDFAEDYAEKEYRLELMHRMRRQISVLSHLQREIMIDFYLENLSIRKIALKYGLTESAVKWHLFSTRKKLKKEITTMENNNYVYRPRKLHMALSGQIISTAVSDINMINTSLTKQNICTACYQTPKTKEALAEQLGIPMAYIEEDLAWLVAREFVAKNASGYSTSFLIFDTASEQGEYSVYLRHKKALSDVITQELAAAQEAIRSIGFKGCESPFDKMLWMLIYQFCRQLDIPYPDMERPVRMDGGKYLPLGFDRTAGDDTPIVVNTDGWSCNGSMHLGDFYWYGLYNFGCSEIQDVLEGFLPEYHALNELLYDLIQSDFQVQNHDDSKKFTLAQLAQKGFVTVNDGLVQPNFYIFTSSQFQQLRQTVFAPIEKKLEKGISLLIADLEAYYKNKLPKQLKHYEKSAVRHALHNLGFLSTFFAFEDGLLYKPTDSHDGEFLTLVYAP